MLAKLTPVLSVVQHAALLQQVRVHEWGWGGGGLEVGWGAAHLHLHIQGWGGPHGGVGVGWGAAHLHIQGVVEKYAVLFNLPQLDPNMVSAHNTVSSVTSCAAVHIGDWRRVCCITTCSVLQQAG